MDKKKSALFFKKIQSMPWYSDFLNPVIHEVGKNKTIGSLLDIGCGPGMLLENINTLPGTRCFGVDTNPWMIEEAKKTPALHDVGFYVSKPGEKLPIENKKFDVITFCSVLFLLDDPRFLLSEAKKILNSGGKIIVLTPTGKGSGVSYFPDNINPRNWGFWMWRNVTKKNARKWGKKTILADFGKEHQLVYQKTKVFKGFASLEVLQTKAYKR
jgi:ubiquinone/menaquinone biosynthesis C-methylase UbiE